MEQSAREQWASGAGFTLAAIGSAVGLGNVWRFSYVAGENGGGAFLLVYLLSMVLLGAPIVIAEMALGRNAQGDAPATFEAAVPGTAWRHAGWLSVAGCVFILTYYTLIAGWALKYLAGGVTGALWREAGDAFGAYFDGFIANGAEPLLWQGVVLAVSMAVVAGGIRKGIEAVNRVLMPVLALFVIGLAGYSATLPGAAAGWRFLLAPDWSQLARTDVLTAAIGQSFFSLGLGMAIFITYAGYLSRQSRIPKYTAAIVAGDIMFALAAGLAIFPAVFAFGGSPAAGPSLAFITLPQIFLAMPGGKVFGVLFFALLVAAACTSIVSLLEVPVTAAVQRTPLGRRGSVILVGGIVFAGGVPVALSYGALADVVPFGPGLLDKVDKSVSNYLLPVAGVLVTLFVGWRWRGEAALAAADLADSSLGTLWRWLLRWAAPAMIGLILLDSAGVL